MKTDILREFKEDLKMALQGRTTWGRNQIIDLVDKLYKERLEKELQEFLTKEL